MSASTGTELPFSEDQILVGIEKEQLRTDPEGALALSPAPSVPPSREGFITTDFSESQAEQVTSPLPGTVEALKAMASLTDSLRGSLKDEILWAGSLPPLLPDEKMIPLARSGQRDPEAARRYRETLAGRYGFLRMMISGIHSNISFPGRGWKSEDYMDGARGLLKDRWLLIWLFGASPTAPPEYSRELLNCVPSPWRKELCIRGRCSAEIFRNAVSLRMSCFGYPPQLESLESLPFSSRQAYTAGVDELVSRGRPLQKESEIYLPVRPKAMPWADERLNDALKGRGIEYLEIRTMDLNPLLPSGIDPDELMLQQIALLHGRHNPPPPDSREDRIRWNRNHHAAALYGRKEGLLLAGEEGFDLPLRELAEQTLAGWESCAASLELPPAYLEALERAKEKIGDPGRLPSSRVYEATGERGENFIRFHLEQSRKHHPMRSK